MLGDKEIAVRIRGNSHYRNSALFVRSSRNAYRLVTRKRSLGQLGEIVKIKVRDSYALSAFCYGRIANLRSQYPVEGTFILSFCKKRKDNGNMKRTVKSSILIILSLVFIVSLVACNTVEKTGAWENATYLRDMEFGNGAKTVTVEVKADDQLVTFTVKTDKDTVGAALLEHDLIAGEESQYGLYLKTVNGMLADYDVDKTYWAFYVDGEYAMTGVDSTEISEGVTYRLERTK